MTTMKNKHPRKNLLVVMAAFFLALWACGCIVSPQPSPPGVDPILDSTKVAFPESPAVLENRVIIAGAADAAMGERLRVFVTNLNRSEDPIKESVETDGSFRVLITGIVTDIFRVQLVGPDLRSEPVDFTISAEELVLGQMAEADSCVRLLPNNGQLQLAELAEGQRYMVEAINDCPDGQTLWASMRSGLQGLQVSPDSISLEPNGSVALEITAVGLSSGEVEDVLFVDVGEPGTHSFAVTVFGIHEP